ncbi:MAG: hypothetical protein AAFW81_01935 [Pseudomonadota bacterium]
MGHFGKLCGLVALAILAIGSNAAAQSTSNPQLAAPSAAASVALEKFDISDVSALLGEYAIATTLLPYEQNDAATLAAETEAGGRFLISMFNCDDAVTGVGCQGAATYTAFSNAGLAYDDLNAFNSTARVTKVVNVEAQNIVILGFQRFFAGGVNRENYEYSIMLFLADVQDYLMAREVAATSVAFSEDAKDLEKTDNLTAQAAPTTAAALGAFSEAGAVAAAISNTGDVGFLPADLSVFVD